MTLKTEVQRRYSENRLIQLSNPDEPENVALMNDRLDAAVDDATGAFQTMAGVTYDNTNLSHRRYAIQGVLKFLFSYQGKKGSEEAVEEWEQNLLEKILPTEASAAFEPLLTDGDFLSEHSTFNDNAFDRVRMRAPRTTDQLERGC